MMRRQNFEHDLKDVELLFKKLAEDVSIAFHNAYLSLEMQQVQLANTVIEKDEELDELEKIINEKAIWIITKQQPVSYDLRKILAIIKMANDLERIGDFAVNIAKSVLRSKIDLKQLEELTLLQMKNQTLDMLQQIVSAFQNRDLQKAMDVAKNDDYIDDQNTVNFQRLQSFLKETNNSESIIELLFINRYIERAADHVTNMAESTVFFINGEIHDLN